MLVSMQNLQNWFTAHVLGIARKLLISSAFFFVKFDDFFFVSTALNVITNFLNSNNDNVVNNTILFYELDEISF